MALHCAYCGRLYSYNHQEKCRKGKRGRRELFNYALSVIEEFEIPIHLNNGSTNFYWNGETIPFPPDLVGRERVGDLRIVLHEMAHWLYATPEERKSPEFELGPGDDDRERNVYAIEAALEKRSPIHELESLLEEIRQKEDVIRRNFDSGSQG